MMKTQISRTFFAMRMMLGVVVMSLALIGCASTAQPTLPATSTPIPAPTAISPSPMPVSTQTGQRKIITLWTHNTPGSVEGDVLAESVKAFEQAQDDYTIEVVPVAPETYATLIAKLWSENLGKKEAHSMSQNL
jgi:ABC-type glycerol-3-phosphate transport system substrate-binding protein